jgi:hypothetical protein
MPADDLDVEAALRSSGNLLQDYQSDHHPPVRAEIAELAGLYERLPRTEQQTVLDLVRGLARSR